MVTRLILRFVCCIIFFTAATDSFSQDSRGVVKQDQQSIKNISGKTLALIIGINYSGRKNYAQLQYAVNDAQLVKSFLQSGLFFDSIPEENIKFIANDEATAAKLWYGFDWLKKNASKGDRAIVYFAGHGISAGPSLSFLIAYDAPDVSDPSQFGFQGGAIPVYQLKTTLEEMRLKGVTNFLITDACRNNEKNDPGQFSFQSIMESDKGEIQFSSCSRNQSSLEDQKWGGGHGLFTYYFIKGMCGFADEESDQSRDGKVTLSELKMYVEKNVRNDSRNLVTNQVKQMPYINISNADDQEQPIAFVRNNAKIREQFREGNLIVGIKRSITDDTSVLMKKFRDALTTKAFFEEQPGNAYSLLNEIRSTRTSDLYDDALQEYIINLLNDAQSRINKYFEGVDSNFTNNYFAFGARETNRALTLMSRDHPLFKVYTINRLFLEARSMRNEKAKFKLAMAKIDSAIALDSSVAYLYHTKGLLLYDNKRYDESLPLFQRAHALSPKWSFPVGLMGDIYSLKGLYVKAKEVYWSSIRSDSNNLDSWNSLGYFFYTRKNYDSAEATFKKGLQINPGYVYCLRNLGDVYTSQHKYTEAQRTYRKALAADSNDSYNYSYLAEFYKNIKKYDSAIVYYRKAIFKDTTNRYGWRALEYLYLDLHRKELAREIVNALMTAQLSDDNDWIAAGEFYKRYEQYDSARICYSRALEINPSSVAALRNSAFTYVYQQRYSDAKKSIFKAITIEPENSTNWSDLGWCYKTAEEFDSAIICFHKAIQLDPTNAYSTRMLGFVEQSRERNLEARNWFLKAADQDSLDEENLNALGSFYFDNKEYDSAIACFTKSYQINSYNTSTLRCLAEAYFKQYTYSTALTTYRTAILIDPEDPENWSAAGDYFKNIDQKDSARIYYDKALLIDPYFTDAYISLGDLYRKQKNSSAAIQVLRRALYLDSMNINALINIGNCYYDMASYDSAMLFYRTAARRDRKSETAYYNIALIFHFGWNQDDSASYFFEKAIEVNPKYIAPYLRLTEISNSKRDLALSYIRKGLATNPADYDLNDKAADLYFEASKYDSAFYCLKNKYGAEDLRYELEKDYVFVSQDKNNLLKFYLKIISQGSIYDSLLYGKVAKIYFESADFENALSWYGKLKNQYSSSYKVDEEIAKVYYSKGLIDSALQTLKRIPASKLTNSARFTMGNIYERSLENRDAAFPYYFACITESDRPSYERISDDEQYALKFCDEYLLERKDINRYSLLYRGLIGNSIYDFKEIDGYFIKLVKGFEQVGKRDSALQYKSLRNQLAHLSDLAAAADYYFQNQNSRFSIQLYQDVAASQQFVRKYFPDFEPDSSIMAKIVICQLRLHRMDSATFYLNKYFKGVATLDLEEIYDERSLAFAAYFSAKKDRENALRCLKRYLHTRTSLNNYKWFDVVEGIKSEQSFQWLLQNAEFIKMINDYEIENLDN